ncbi:MAG: hypothetical protein ACJAT2_001525 [Bacteriovoracaceae bacterium]|jgi:hypothetical protein
MLRFVLILFVSFSFNASAKDWVEVYQEDDITIKTINEADGVMPFKAEGVIKHSLPKIVAALKDYQNKHRWSPKLKSVKLHSESKNDTYIFSEFYKTPWPASDREFLLEGSIKKIKKGVVSFEASSVDLPSLIDEDHVQAQVHKLNVLLEELDKDVTKITFEFYGDLGGWIPTWLMNVIQKKWPLRFIQGLNFYINSH